MRITDHEGVGPLAEVSIQSLQSFQSDPQQLLNKEAHGGGRGGDTLQSGSGLTCRVKLLFLCFLNTLAFSV